MEPKPEHQIFVWDRFSDEEDGNKIYRTKVILTADDLDNSWTEKYLRNKFFPPWVEIEYEPGPKIDWDEVFSRKKLRDSNNDIESDYEDEEVVNSEAKEIIDNIERDYIEGDEKACNIEKDEEVDYTDGDESSFKNKFSDDSSDWETISENEEVDNIDSNEVSSKNESSDHSIDSESDSDDGVRKAKIPRFEDIISKKCQAMKIVRTVGQAFEVCHKMQTNTPDNPAPSTSSAPDDIRIEHKEPKEPASECGASESGAPSTSKSVEETKPNRPQRLDLLPPPPKKEGKRSQRTVVPSINLPDLPECVTEVKAEKATPCEEIATPLSVQHELQLSRQQLELQKQQTRAAVAQISLLRDQLAAEQSARNEAQARTHQLLVHNKELLDHIAALVAHLQEKEKGISRPISAQQLTQLPQTNAGGTEAVKSDNASACNGNFQPFNTDDLINFVAQNSQKTQNVENNNVNLSPFCVSPPTQTKRPGSAPSFENMSNEQIQNYLISKFQDMEFKNSETKANNNKQFYQNCNAFPHIPPLSNNFSNSDLAALLNDQMAQFKEKLSSSDEFGALAQAMSIGNSQNSLYSTSQATTSKDSSPDGLSSDDSLPFIMPLSHNGTLTATGNDGRVRLIVPISPSGSTSEVGESSKVEDGKSTSGMTLKVPGAESLAPAAPITRSTSEKVPNRSEMMTALRSQWTRHTTK